ncbi:MAG TPA: hemolysin family protein [Propionibacteriaceae bacterium]|nr:hemolysin family protein [Propionibacteriaceae bacterium]
MNQVLQDVLLILLFILIGGVFAAAEMSLVSLRESQLKQLAERGKRGAKVAELSLSPNRFLSAVQIGVTLSGFLSAAFGGATLAERLTPVLVRWGLPQGLAATVSLVLITLAISYFSIVLGELAAKRLAMQRAEAFAMALAPLVDAIAKAVRPLIWFLGVSTNAVVRLFGGDPSAGREQVTEEEIRALVSGAPSFGIEERKIVDELFDAGERSLREVMVPRTEVDFLAGSMSAHAAMREVRGAPHSRYPVTGQTVDEVLGFLHVRDLMDLDASTRNWPVSRLVRPVISLPETVKILHALSEMRRTGSQLAIVADEYGGTAGIVTLEDLVEELVGEIQDEHHVAHVSFVRLSGAVDVDGLITLEDFAERTGYQLPEGPYDTVAGYWVAQRGELPEVGDTIRVSVPQVAGTARSTFDMTVTELDGRRAARITIRPAEDEARAGGRDERRDESGPEGRDEAATKEGPAVEVKEIEANLDR